MKKEIRFIIALCSTFLLIGIQQAVAKDYEELFTPEWEEVKEAIQLESSLLLTSSIERLERERRARGFRALSAFSMSLLAEAKKREGTDFEKELLQGALILSPEHPSVLYAAHLHVTGFATWDALFELLSAGWQYPSLLMPMLASCTYPILFAITFGFLLSAIFVVVTSSVEILRPFYRYGRKFRMPQMFTGVVVLLLAASVPLGPLAVVACISLLLSQCEKWFLFMGGALLICWGFIIPLQENFNYWGHHPEVQAAFRSIEGDYHQGDRAAIESLLTERPEDPLILSSYAILLRQYGELVASTDALTILSQLEGKRGWISSQLGLNAFINEEAEEAEKFFSRARKQNYTPAEVLFFMSKAKFDLLKTSESDELYRKAKKKDPELVTRLEHEEELLGQRYPGALTKLERPSRFYFDSASIPFLASWIEVEKKVPTLFRPFSWRGITLIGGVLMLLFFLPQAISRRSQFICYVPNREGIKIVSLFPGGLMVAALKPYWSIPFTTLFCLCVFIIFGWPREIGVIFADFPDLPIIFVFVAFFPLLFSYWIGWRWYRGVRP